MKVIRNVNAMTLTIDINASIFSYVSTRSGEIEVHMIQWEYKVKKTNAKPKAAKSSRGNKSKKAVE